MDDILEPKVQTTVKRKTSAVPNHTLKRERELRGWSQSALAEKIGAQSNLVNRWETGSAFPSPYYREKLCSLFEKNAEELQLIKGTNANPSAENLSPPLALPDTTIPTNEAALPPLHPQQKFSRRTMLFGLGGAGAAVVGIGGVSWWIASHPTSPPIHPVLPTITNQYIYKTTTNTDVNEVFWSPLGTLIACVNGDNTIPILKAATGELTLTYRGHTKFVNYATWSPKQMYIASASGDQTVQVWNSTTGQSQLTYSQHTSAVICVAWSPDGALIASSDNNGSIHVWDAFSGRIMTRYLGHTKTVKSLSWSPDSQSIASCGSDGTIQVWSATTGVASNEFRYQGSRNKTIFEVTWSLVGNRLVTAQADSTVVIWDALTGGYLLSYKGHTDTVYAARWSPDSQYIASCGADNTIQIWKATTGERLLTYKGHPNTVYEVSWSPDGHHLASGSADHSMHVCQVTLP